MAPDLCKWVAAAGKSCSLCQLATQQWLVLRCQRFNAAVVGFALPALQKSSGWVCVASASTQVFASFRQWLSWCDRQLLVGLARLGRSLQRLVADMN